MTTRVKSIVNTGSPVGIKRRASQQVNIAFLSALSILSPLTLTACDADHPDQASIQRENSSETAVVYTFRDAAHCQESGRFSAETCQDAWGRAVQEYRRVVPGYTSLEECQTTTHSETCDVIAREDQPQSSLAQSSTGTAPNGSVTTPHSGGGFLYISSTHPYSPPMSGYTMAAPAPNQTAQPHVQPVYRAAGGELRTPSNITGLRIGEVMSVPRSSMTSAGGIGAAARPMVVARGGFGATGHAISVGG
jgi:hypothetical protein